VLPPFCALYMGCLLEVHREVTEKAQGLKGCA
jgi:hypothetical protein